MKYVRLYGDTLMVFSLNFVHADMARRGGDGRPVISAGFIRHTLDGPEAYGESESLGVSAKPEEDTPLIRQFFGSNAQADSSAVAD